ncbi:hypothetical protein DFH09DRAFT_1452253 [Mycena vulgaris]|nr:hypothetical protein DFH09DRAFT_1452253 [Mycena vulgaris]
MDEEEVPDSDTEEYLPLHPNPVQTTTSTPTAPAPRDSISPFSAVKAVASTKDSISTSSSVPRPRPKPKPTYKGAAGSKPADTSLIASFPEIMSSLSDRVKMRNRATPKTSISDAISSSSSRRPAVIVSSDVIEIADSEDELDLNSKSKGAFKKKPGSKFNGSALPTSSFSSNMPMPSPRQPAPILRTTIPSSDLPPSDPFPQSTGMTRYQPEHDGDDEGFVPPIATLTAAGDTSFEPLDSSPSRFAHRKETARPKPKPKPKKPKPPAPDNHDELRQEERFGGRDMHMMGPPFIPHASPVAPPLPPVAGPSSSTAAAPPDPLPNLLATIGAPSGKAPKKRKKQGDDEGEKEKPVKKPRTKKAKKDAEGGEGGGEDKPKKKGKGKEKEKEEFKSREFIDDDEDEDVPPAGGAPPLPLPSLMDGVVPGGVGGSSNKPMSVTSIPDSQADEELVPLKRKRTEGDEADVAESKGNGAATPATGKKNKKAKTAGVGVEKTKKKGPAKKAKGRTVMSDDEEDATGGEPPVPADVMPAGSVPNRLKTTPPAQTESDVGDDAPQAKVKPAKKKQAKKTVVSESEGEGDDAFQNKPDVSTISKPPFTPMSPPLDQENSPPRPSSKSQIENTTFDGKSATSPKKNLEETPKSLFPSISSKYTIAPRT